MEKLEETNKTAVNDCHQPSRGKTLEIVGPEKERDVVKIGRLYKN
jgi:hypothetical protein